MKIIVDRIEGEYLILETEIGKTIEVPKWLIPDAKENDMIKIEVDQKKTKKRKKEIANLMNQVFEGEESS